MCGFLSLVDALQAHARKADIHDFPQFVEVVQMYEFTEELSRSSEKNEKRG